MRVQLPSVRLFTRNVGWGLTVTIASVVGTIVGTVVLLMVLHIICNILGIDEVGIWFYGSPSGANWGLNFFNMGGLELNGPDSLSFFTCQGQC